MCFERMLDPTEEGKEARRLLEQRQRPIAGGSGQEFWKIRIDMGADFTVRNLQDDTRIDTDPDGINRGYVEDFYGRRWAMPPPGRMWSSLDGLGGRRFHPSPGLMDKKQIRNEYKTFEHRRHIYANRGTQTSQATTTLWAIALCILGEYVELQTPECLGGYNIFPEAAGWALNGGPGPGGKPFQAWAMNTVHDSLYTDGAPGYLEAAAKLITRRFNGVPADFLQESDMPWRIDFEVGPDMANLRPYNQVAKEFGFEPLPDR